MGVILYVYRQYGIRICAADKLVAGLRYIKKKNTGRGHQLYREVCS